jgi:hypothetical protein
MTEIEIVQIMTLDEGNPIGGHWERQKAPKDAQAQG